MESFFRFLDSGLIELGILVVTGTAVAVVVLNQKGCPNCGYRWNTLQRLDFATEDDRNNFYQVATGAKISLKISCKKCGTKFIKTYPIARLTGNLSKYDN